MQGESKVNEKPLVIVVEDSHVVQRMIKSQLEKIGLEVEVAKNGAEGLNVIDKNFQSGKEISLVVTDIDMPEMDGLAMCEQIRGKEGLENLPILFITGIQEKETLLKAKKFKPIGFIIKPFQQQVLYEKISPVFPSLDNEIKKVMEDR